MPIRCRAVYFINNKNGTFTTKALPTEAQLSPMYGIAAEDFDRDGNMDILMGGNFYQSKPEAGIYDASYGILLKGDGKGNFTAMPAQQSGINISGAVRDIAIIQTGKKKLVLIAKNNDNIQITTILMNRNMKTVGIVFIILCMLIGCSEDSDMDKYNSLVKKELASNKRVDSIFFGIHLGMAQERLFYALLGDE